MSFMAGDMPAMVCCISTMSRPCCIRRCVSMREFHGSTPMACTSYLAFMSMIRSSTAV